MHREHNSPLPLCAPVVQFMALEQLATPRRSRQRRLRLALHRVISWRWHGAPAQLSRVDPA